MAADSYQPRPISIFASQQMRHTIITSPLSYRTAQSSLASYATALSGPRSGLQQSALRGLLETRSNNATQTAGQFNSGSGKDEDVSLSKWLKLLQIRGILLDPEDELDWSGKGQHLEYEAGEEHDIPLEPIGVLGHSATAIVESVRCRRILLARKTIRCNRQITKEDVVTEVEHLQRLQHAHIVRVVGTYTLRKTFSILLYPAADHDFDDFMDDIVEHHMTHDEHALKIMPKFFGCLSAAMSFIHESNVKHMDIKPKNILVRRTQQEYKVYIADFGIAKAYRSAAESFTDSATLFTRAYAAPEVVMQDTRGYPADVFSLGCVFMEMFACMLSTQGVDQRARLTGVRGTAYHAHIVDVVSWYRARVQEDNLKNELGPNGWHILMLPGMLDESPELRPRTNDLQQATAHLSCRCCNAGPEPFEASFSDYASTSSSDSDS